MPHTQRKKSESGFYHVVSKGDGGQVIFEGDADRACYLRQLGEAQDGCHVKIHAYCLMSNHVHLIIEDREQELSSFMKRLNERYAQYFAKSTGRVGHVFQGRFWSEPINTDEYFLAALRYVHANPEPAGVCQAADYPWSSYKHYIGKAGQPGKGGKKGKTGQQPVVETAFALKLLGGAEEFERFSASGGKFAQPFPGSQLRRHLSPDELAQVALNILGRDTLNDIRAMKPPKRMSYLIQLSQAGFTETEIARVTGLGQASIYRALKKS